MLWPHASPTPRPAIVVAVPAIDHAAERGVGEPHRRHHVELVHLLLAVRIGAKNHPHLPAKPRVACDVVRRKAGQRPGVRHQAVQRTTVEQVPAAAVR